MSDLKAQGVAVGDGVSLARETIVADGLGVLICVDEVKFFAVGEAESVTVVGTTVLGEQDVRKIISNNDMKKLLCKTINLLAAQLCVDKPLAF